MAEKIKHILISSVLIIVLAFSVGSLVGFGGVELDEAPEAEVIVEEIPEPIFEYGLAVDSFIVSTSKIKKNQFLADILLKHHIPYPEIDKLVKQTKSIFDVRDIRANKKYTIFSAKDSTEKAQYFVYEPNAIEYIVFNLKDFTASKGERDIETVIKTTHGTINSSLYQTLVDANTSAKLAVELANIYAWTIDFYRIQKGDAFQVIYEEKQIKGEAIGVGKIIAANFEHRGEPYYAFDFEQNGYNDYFDEKAQSLRKAFLKAPLKFSRISSRYSLNRYHPVQKRNKPHYGTDYAAPKGTPIMAVGNGTVIDSKYSKFNGNYVKIKHNGTYTTQYLHMNKRAVNKGQAVKQGDIIGYVGSTGLATGPHVCFRFWKNGKQVDHLKEKFPPSLPVEKQLLPQYNATMDSLKNVLNTIDAVKVEA